MLTLASRAVACTLRGPRHQRGRGEESQDPPGDYAWVKARSACPQPRFICEQQCLGRAGRDLAQLPDAVPGQPQRQLRGLGATRALAGMSLPARRARLLSRFPFDPGFRRHFSRPNVPPSTACKWPTQLLLHRRESAARHRRPAAGGAHLNAATPERRQRPLGLAVRRVVWHRRAPEADGCRGGPEAATTGARRQGHRIRAPCAGPLRAAEEGLAPRLDRLPRGRRETWP